jgi:uncharacterized protein with HEPN domain
VIRRADTRLEDIAAACDAIRRYIRRADMDDEIVFDAIRIRLIEIGEAVKDLDASVTVLEPEIPWGDIARMRDHLAHRYFDTTHAIVDTTARHDIPRLANAVRRLLGDALPED